MQKVEAMNGLLVSLEGAISQGVLWGIMVLGVYITYKLLNIADLTVDGSFALGGCVCATLIVSGQMNPILALCIATLAGLLAGAITGFLHTIFEIPAILAGILTQIALWSINLRIMGKSNVPLLKVDTIFSKVVNFLGMEQMHVTLILGVLIVLAIIAILYWFFGTEIGSVLRATGNNENMIRALGVNTKKSKMVALMLSNGLVALSGGIVAQSQKYADIGMGTGAIVIGLAAIVIGDVIFRKVRNFAGILTSAVVGSVVYFVIRALVLRLGMNANDMKLFSAVFVALALCIPVLIRKYKQRRDYSEGGEKNGNTI